MRSAIPDDFADGAGIAVVLCRGELERARVVVGALPAASSNGEAAAVRPVIGAVRGG